jgi:hypothetical protein
MSTHSDFLSTCDPYLTPIVATRLNSFTPRRAVDSTGRLGSFYDACCDQVLHNSVSNFVPELAKSRGPPQCFIKTCKREEPSNLLELLNMNRELRLSVALQMAREMGVGALINYSRPIDKYTRLICYSYFSGTDYLSDDEFKLLSRNKSSMPDTLATHVIVLVNWGIDAVAVLQLPPDDELINAIDYALDKLCILLSNDQTNVVLSQDDKRFLEKIVHTEVFSNVPDLARINLIIDFYYEISRVKNDISLIKPYIYNLCPIQTFYSLNNITQGIFNEMQEEHVKRIEHYLLQLSRNFKRLRTEIDQGYPNLQQHLKDLFSEMLTRWSNLEQKHMGEIQRIHHLVVGVRRGKIEHKRIHEILNNDRQVDIMKSINDFGYDLNVMQEKEHFISDLLHKDFEYRNAIDYGVQNGDDEQKIACKLFVDGKRDRVICCNDILRVKKKSERDKLSSQLIKEHKENPQLRLIYVDFSYCSYELHDFIILSTTDKNKKVDVPKTVAASTLLERPKSDDIINILLLGESGAGKSTFINAFVNYLLFNTLEQARNKSIVLIPVSFVMTIGDDFKERQVTFGGMDTLSSEDHDHPGQSVTQHCKSYVFTLKDGNNRGKKLRIIDTPGIGDVRGLAQDDINMQHILSYINNLTHLNAVCILMKPNNVRLNIFFRSCFVQLFDLLGESAGDKIIFCFTNARATFYTPGNTAPLLKNLLQSLPVKDIPFTKNNTFCFDNGSFRYLMALQNGIEFSGSQEKKYDNLWNRSSTESKRFLEYIRTNMTAFLVLGEYKSMKDAQLKIRLMIRPMLEAMRNILRNIVLWNAGYSMVSIELRPRPIKDSTAICLTCPRQSLRFGDFWITTDGLHVFHNKCRTCGCSPNDHYPIDYQLEYEICNYPASNSDNDITKMVDDLCQAGAEFAHFLLEATDTSQNDLFLTGIERMIKEEGDICTNKRPCHLNPTLLGQIEQLKENYEETRKKRSTRKEHVQLLNVYDKIRQVSKYPMIESQMTAIKQWHKFMMKHYEDEVST